MRADLARASSAAPVAAISAKNAPPSKARSSRTSMPGPSKWQQPPGQPGLVALGHRADRGAEQAAGAGLGQRHQPQRRVAGQAQPVADLPQPGPVAAGVGDLEGVQPIEGDGAQPGKAHARACAAGPAARPPPRTALATVPGPDGGADPAAPSPTAGAGSARPARRSACPTPAHSPGPGTSPARARSTPRLATAAAAAGAAPCASRSRTSSTSSNGRYWVNPPR